VPAGVVRELAYAFHLLPRPEPDLTDLPGDDEAMERPREDATTQAAEQSTEQAVEQAAEAEPSAGRGSSAPTKPSSAPPPLLTPTPLTRTRTTPVRDRPLAEWMALAAARHEAAAARALTGARRAVLDEVWTDGDERALLDLGALLAVREVAGTTLAHRPHVAVVDQLRGSLVALTDAAGLRRGAALGPPAGTDEHDPSAGLAHFVRLRDRRCRFPGCRARARGCDLDHKRPWPHGRTEHTNLCCLCEHHHRLKHQAPGWRFEEVGDGGLAITMPNGEVRVSHPPRFGTDLDLPPY
jgi:hypothetical protein